MKKFMLPLLAFSLMLLSSCSVVGGIFKAGAYTGIIAVVVVVLLVVFVIAKMRRK